MKIPVLGWLALGVLLVLAARQLGWFKTGSTAAAVPPVAAGTVPVGNAFQSGSLAGIARESGFTPDRVEPTQAGNGSSRISGSVITGAVLTSGGTQTPMGNTRKINLSPVQISTEINPNANPGGLQAGGGGFGQYSG